MAGAARKLRSVDGGKAPARRAKTAATNRGGRPKSRLTSTLTEGSTEREMLVVLRAKIAKQLDAGVPTHSFDKLTRQFLQLDARIRSIDAREAEADENADGDDEDDDDQGWNPNNV